MTQPGSAEQAIATQRVAGLSVPLSFIVLLVLLAKCLANTDGHQPYSLDDAYIHLQLARNIARGTYGINPGEWAAPSSSLLWPLLLAPFAKSSFATALPLIYNMLATLTSVWWMEALFSRLLQPRAAVGLSLAAAWSLNLFGLAFTGMEHSLQVMLVVILAAHLSGRSAPKPLLYACLVLLPWVRYESLAISLPAGICLWLREPARAERRRLAALLALSLAGLLAFSLLLRAHGLGWLPSSVLLKQGLLPARLDIKLMDAFAHLVENTDRLRVLVVLVIIAALAPAVRREAPHLSALLLASSALVLSLGRVTGRHEVQYVVFATLLLAALTLPQLQRFAEPLRVWPVALVMLLLLPELWVNTLKAPRGAEAIYEQQFQMGSIVRDFLRAPVAVNDLGLVSWLGGQRVLDLWGLGSYETLLARNADPSGAWFEAAVRKHGVEYVFIYSPWMPKIPRSWTMAGRLSLLGPRVYVGLENVELYATNPSAARKLAAALHAYRETSQLAAASVAVYIPSAEQRQDDGRVEF